MHRARLQNWLKRDLDKLVSKKFVRNSFTYNVMGIHGLGLKNTKLAGRCCGEERNFYRS